MKTIGIITNFNKSQAVDLLAKVVRYSKELGFDVWVQCSGIADGITEQCCEAEQFHVKGVEAVVVLGGDGTMLDSAHQMGRVKLPMMGLNIGSLGYLTSVEDHQYKKALRHLYDGSFSISERTALSVRVMQEDGGICYLPDALNDAVVTRGATGHAANLELVLDGMSVSRFLCDGIIVATPTGSTAYSLSAGGPILMPATPAFVMSLICPHSLTSRPLVLQDTSDITVRVVECGSPMIASSDGRKNAMVDNGDCIEIRRSSQTVPVIELHGYNPYEVLRRKLSWGGRAAVSG
ncbi:MAG: NAD(+)/NADH kinase [Kiritimatiellia bacterium]